MKTLFLLIGLAAGLLRALSEAGADLRLRRAMERVPAARPVARVFSVLVALLAIGLLAIACFIAFAVWHMETYGP